jgi:hypothetical protein
MEIIYEFKLWDLGTFWFKEELYPSGYSVLKYISKGI